MNQDGLHKFNNDCYKEYMSHHIQGNTDPRIMCSHVGYNQCILYKAKYIRCNRYLLKSIHFDRPGIVDVNHSCSKENDIVYIHCLVH